MLVIITLSFLGISSFIGFKSGFLKLEIISKPWYIILKLVAVTLFAPAILEEIFFRGLLIPHPIEKVSIIEWLLWSSASLIFFIIYHPTNSAIFYKKANSTFTHPIFLWIAGLLGVTCILLYQVSNSLYYAILLHWLSVLAWLLFLGGFRRLNQEM